MNLTPDNFLISTQSLDYSFEPDFTSRKSNKISTSSFPGNEISTQLLEIEPDIKLLEMNYEFLEVGKNASETAENSENSIDFLFYNSTVAEQAGHQIASLLWKTLANLVKQRQSLEPENQSGSIEDLSQYFTTLNLTDTLFHKNPTTTSSIESSTTTKQTSSSVTYKSGSPNSCQGSSDSLSSVKLGLNSTDQKMSVSESPNENPIPSQPVTECIRS